MVASAEAGFHNRCSSDSKITSGAVGGGGDAASREKGIAVESVHAKCECCGLSEECTEAYMERVRSLFCRRFICGLCAEAVKEEERRIRAAKVQVDPVAEALHRHMAVCAQFSCSVRENPAAHLRIAAAAMRQLLLRRRIYSSSSISISGLPLSSSCLPAIGRSFSSQT